MIRKLKNRSFRKSISINFRAGLLVSVLLLSTLLSLPLTKSVQAAGGSGTEESPYLISSCNELQDIKLDLDAYYKILNDIDCSETEEWNDGAGFEPIGNEEEPFLGELEGNGYKVNNLFIDREESLFTGLFGWIGDEENQIGLVKNLGLEDINITGSISTGGLVGMLYGQINNTYTTGEINGYSEVGGLVGNHGGVWHTVIDSWSSVDVSSNGYAVGGLVGFNGGDSNIINSYATGDVYGESSLVGGLVGYNIGNIQEAHATGDVSTDGYHAGGLTGRNDGNISKAYATGNVYAKEDYAGGLAGQNVGTIEESYSFNREEEGVGVYSECVAGGLIGINSSDGEIKNSYSRSSSYSSGCDSAGLVTVNWGAIRDTYATGVSNGDSGLVEYAMPGSINETSFWDKETSGKEIACGYEDEGIDCDEQYRFLGRTTSQMKDIETYTDDLGEEAWDFEEIWQLDNEINDGYPSLRIVGATLTDQPDHEPNDNFVDDNGDGINDNEQNLVKFRSNLTNKIVILELSDECEFEANTKSEAQLDVQDSGYDYPENLVGFNADCGENGFTATVKHYYFDRDPKDLILRKYNTKTKAYFNVSNAVIEKKEINGQTVTKVTFQVQDGSDLDSDGEIDGKITDPAGLASSVVGTPNTGVIQVNKILFKSNY